MYTLVGHAAAVKGCRDVYGHRLAVALNSMPITYQPSRIYVWGLEWQA